MRGEEELAKENNVVFVSEDGFKFRLFINGKEMLTKGIVITAGLDQEVEVSGTFVAFDTKQKIISDYE
jgi:hypothetical protein